METRRHHHGSRRTRAVALACLVVVPVIYLLTGWCDLYLWIPGQKTRSVHIGNGSIGYSSFTPEKERLVHGPQVRLHSFGLDGDFDFREQRGGWFIEYALWPVPLATAVWFAWAWRWRAITIGACEGCGYPLEGQGPCPECGRSAQRAVA